MDVERKTNRDKEIKECILKNNAEDKLNGKFEDYFDEKNIFNFPDFFELDLVNSWDENVQSEDINIRPLLNIIKKNKILLLQNLDQFYVNSIVYFHREVIYKGKISLMEYEQQIIKDCLIKKFSINNFNELILVCKEIEIYYMLKNCYGELTPSEKDEFKNPLCDILACYFDIEENYFYIFYDYYPSFLSSQMLLEKLTLKQKLIIIKKILMNIKFLHCQGVLNRDIKLESFLIDENLNIKLFDISNAMRIEDLTDLNNSDNLFLTPKWVAPEITRCYPKHGFHQDIWSLGCCLIEFLLDYDKYKNHLLEKLMSKIFSNEKNIDFMPKIPKDIDEETALFISRCLIYSASQRINILDLIKMFNEIIKKHELKEIKLNQSDSETIKFYTDISQKKFVFNFDETNYKNGNCPHDEKIRKYYCIECKKILCDNCLRDNHETHKFLNILIDLENKTTILANLFESIDSIICETTFNYIENFKISFEKDFANEENRIKTMFKEIRKSIDNLEVIQLEALKKSRDEFLINKFDNIFKEAEITKKYYSFYKESKGQFFSHYHRLNNSLKANEINIKNYPSFKDCFDKFHEYSEVLKHYSLNLNKKCNELKLSGKYTFRHENYSEEISKHLKATASKISLDKHKFFDYLGYDILQINKELLMIIPLTNCVVSYNKNIYKKIQCDFDEKKTKIKNFLPGSSTVHVRENLYITGGELHDEAVSFFLSVNIQDKIVEELVELNYARRFHTMVNILDKYVMVIGGWNSSQVEMIDLSSCKIWEILPSMSCERSDCTAYLFNSQYIYVFGGWDYNTKICIPDVEKYELFDNLGSLNTKTKWEIIRVKNNALFLQKYNMGLIPLINEKSDLSEKILLVGGFDDEYDYSSSVVKVEILSDDDILYVSRDVKGLPTDGESSFWYEKTFHIIKNELDNEVLAVNFNSFNNLYAFSFNKYEFKLFINEFT